MKPYPEYKPTGLSWLPQVPSGWKVERLKTQFDERKENNKGGEELMILSLMKDVGVIPYAEKGNVGNKSKDDISQYKVARKGDLVLNSMNVIIGSVGVTPYDGLISPAYYSLMPRQETDVRYYDFLFHLPGVQQAIRGYAKGIMEIRLRISTIDLLGMKFPVPPPAEQRAIVSYLDRETAKIDRLIQLKERMVELLNEKRGAIISSVVTGKVEVEKVGGGVGVGGEESKARVEVEGGVSATLTQRTQRTQRAQSDAKSVGADVLGRPQGQNPCNPWLKFTIRPRRPDELTDSGVDWLGPVPQGWNTIKMQYLFSEKSIKGFPLEPLVAATQNHGVILKSDYENRTVIAQNGLENLKLVVPGDFVISLRSFEGGIELSHVRGIISPAYTILDVKEPMTREYFRWLGKSFAFIQLLKLCVTGIREGQNINYDKLKRKILPIPPLPEQRAIVAYLDAVTAKIDAAVKAIEKSIGLLKERRVRLVSDAVTGRGRVSEK